MDKIKITTSTGFKCVIEKDKLDDMRVVRAIRKTQGDTATVGLAAVELTELILDEKTRERLDKHVMLEDGRIPTKAYMDEIGDIFAKFSEQVKNVSSS